MKYIFTGTFMRKSCNLMSGVSEMCLIEASGVDTKYWSRRESQVNYVFTVHTSVPGSLVGF